VVALEGDDLGLLLANHSKKTVLADVSIRLYLLEATGHKPLDPPAHTRVPDVAHPGSAHARGVGFVAMEASLKGSAAARLAQGGLGRSS
jgi:hypothetical protein